MHRSKAGLLRQDSCLVLGQLSAEHRDPPPVTPSVAEVPWSEPVPHLYHTVHGRIQGTTEGLVGSMEHTPQGGPGVREFLAGTEASEVTCMNLCDHFSFLSNKAFAGRKPNKTNHFPYLVPGHVPYDKL